MRVPEHRVFVVEKFFRLRSYLLIKEAFVLRFPDRQLPSKLTIEINVRNIDETVRERGRTVRSEKNIEAVRNQLKGNPRVSTKQKPVRREPSRQYKTETS